MSEKVAAVRKAAGGSASPGIGIFKSWQGIVEMILRAVTLVSPVMVIVLPI